MNPESNKDKDFIKLSFSIEYTDIVYTQKDKTAFIYRYFLDSGDFNFVSEYVSLAIKYGLSFYVADHKSVNKQYRECVFIPPHKIKSVYAETSFEKVKLNELSLNPFSIEILDKEMQSYLKQAINTNIEKQSYLK